MLHACDLFHSGVWSLLFQVVPSDLGKATSDVSEATERIGGGDAARRSRNWEDLDGRGRRVHRENSDCDGGDPEPTQYVPSLPLQPRMRVLARLLVAGTSVMA